MNEKRQIEGVKGDRIPVIARILCLADSYDAMTSNRVYRPRLPDETVMAELKKNSGSQFDPAMTEVFVRMLLEKKIVPVQEESALV